MLESLLSGFANISVPELVLIAGMALVASVVGGVAGYGTGALMPLVLVPIVGAEPVVPILSLSALFTNTSRSAAFWPLIDQRRAWIVLAAAVPTCALGAWGYTITETLPAPPPSGHGATVSVVKSKQVWSIRPAEGLFVAARPHVKGTFCEPVRFLEVSVTGPIDGPIWVAPQEDVVFYVSPGPGKKPGLGPGDKGRKLWMLRF